MFKLKRKKNEREEASKRTVSNLYTFFKKTNPKRRKK